MITIIIIFIVTLSVVLFNYVIVVGILLASFVLKNKEKRKTRVKIPQQL